MKLFKLFVLFCLDRAVRTFFRTNPHIRLVAVVGSVGKTTTKATIADILFRSLKVRTNRGNYNAVLSAPLEMLGVASPDNPRSLRNWLSVLKEAHQAARRHHDIEVIVQEFGIDRPGEMATFRRPIRPDITIITAIADEHMEFFGTLDNVAREECLISEVSETVLYNRDDIDPTYVPLIKSERVLSYTTGETGNYRIVTAAFTPGKGFQCQLIHGDQTSRSFLLPVIGDHQLRIAAGAAAVALELGLDIETVLGALEAFTPVAGRMNLLEGRHGATIIDDTYNASPLAVASALTTLARLPAQHKIAILGDMNELGGGSDEAHSAIGKLCDPAVIDHLITVGPQARNFLAPAARQQGCTVTSFDTAPEAHHLLKTLIAKDTILLFKGSQGGIYLEEAIKPFLKHPDDSQKLVRQSPDWLKKKQAFFAQGARQTTRP